MASAIGGSAPHCRLCPALLVPGAQAGSALTALGNAVNCETSSAGRQEPLCGAGSKWEAEGLRSVLVPAPLAHVLVLVHIEHVPSRKGVVGTLNRRVHRTAESVRAVLQELEGPPLLKWGLRHRRPSLFRPRRLGVAARGGRWPGTSRCAPASRHHGKGCSCRETGFCVTRGLSPVWQSGASRLRPLCNPESLRKVSIPH